ncbi:phosphodiester glycosidase family protein [Ostreiculturibacter nitratireducens]|uniref:phosphodiester glycosidase family protein n=1 Tax=Ostreiculturibacter nitratireducens TaxID=3075226 RepID=UPI0031B56879
MKTATIEAAFLALWLAAPAAAAEPCRDVSFEETPYTICTVSADEDLRLWLTGPDGRPMGSFDRLRETVEGEGKALVFAMNAGMYHPDRRPVGLYVEDGGEVAPLVTSAGPGNFGMLPNGVFCISGTGFAVIESRTFASGGTQCRHATQSGPMLVIGGELHPRFLPDSDSRYIRNGVGVSPDGQTAYFAIADRPVTFHEFGRLFRDEFDAPNALYFDGKISRLYAPGLDRHDTGFPMGPIVGLVAASR